MKEKWLEISGHVTGFSGQIRGPLKVRFPHLFFICTPGTGVHSLWAQLPVGGTLNGDGSEQKEPNSGSETSIQLEAAATLGGSRGSLCKGPGAGANQAMGPVWRSARSMCLELSELRGQ